MTIALGIRVRRDALEVEIIEFSIDLKARSKCLSFMSRVKVGIQSEGILQIALACPFLWPNYSPGHRIHCIGQMQ